jgi:ribosomal protein S6
MEVKEPKTQVYELGFHLSPEIGDDNVAKEFGDIKSLIEEAGGTFISEEAPHSMPLAYDMEKVIANKKNTYSKAYFGWVKFELTSDKLAELKTKFDEMVTIVRFLLVKTVRESTLAPKKIVQKIEGAAPKRTMREKETAGPMIEAEVDKEIDALLGDEPEAVAEVATEEPAEESATEEATA